VIAANRIRDDPSVFQRLPGKLEHQPLLGVHRRSLARRDAEEGGVEPVDPVEECAEPRRRLGNRMLPAGQ
jgi:hypothetical protein